MFQTNVYSTDGTVVNWRKSKRQLKKAWLKPSPYWTGGSREHWKELLQDYINSHKREDFRKFRNWL